jgi:nitrogen fixation protein FixH
MMMNDIVKKSDGRLVLMCFVAFFAVIIVVNSIFIYMALQTHSGVVVKNPYEKGLAFNQTLQAAKSQPDLKHDVSYSDGVLRWTLPIINASVTAGILRSVRDGYDFDIALKHIGNGVYEAKPAMPLPGAWTAKLKATWNNQTFQTSHDFIAQ